MRVLIFGPLKSGKSQLAHLLVGRSYEENYRQTVGVDYFMKITVDSTEFQIWEVGGNERFKALTTYYYREANILCYCVDLTKSIDSEKIKEDIQNGLALVNEKESVKIILIGTKSDDPKASAANINAFNQLELGMEVERMIISAKNDTAYSVENNKPFTIKDFFQNLLKKIIKGNTASPEIILEKKPQIAPNPPSSYTNIWLSTSTDSQSLIALLKDYNKTSGAPGFFETLKSTAHLIVSGHWFRNHHKAVAATLIASPSTTPPKQILETLEKNLIDKGEPIKPDGSLAKRIRFIQEKIGRSVIDIEALNDKIKDNEDKTPNCCF